MAKVYICNRDNKKNLAEIEERFEEEGYDYGFLCLKQCGNPMRVKVDGELIIGKDLDDLIIKINEKLSSM